MVEPVVVGAVKAGDAIRDLGGASQVAAGLGLPRTTVAGWRRGRGLIPSWHVEAILQLAQMRGVRLIRRGTTDAVCVGAKSKQHTKALPFGRVR